MIHPRSPASHALLTIALAIGLVLGGCDRASLGSGSTVAAAAQAATASPSAQPSPTASATPTSTATATIAPSTATATQPAQASPTAGATPATGATPAATATTATAPSAQSGSDTSLIAAVRRVVDQRKPAVVLVANLAGSGAPDPIQPVPQQRGIGSGVIIDAAGHIVTNNHVVEGAQTLRVVLPDGRTFDAKLVGRDPRTDLAVVKIDGQNLPTAPLAPRVNVAVGDWVVAIGNALGLPGGPTVTAGVVGALGRTIREPNGVGLEDMIQTDAAINPGNSGGPLFNLNGEVVGINTAGIQGAEGLGFAVSINTVRDVVPQLIDHGRIIRPFIGVSVATITPGLAARFDLPREDGLLIVDVGHGTPAASAGLRPGDILLAVDGRPTKTEGDLRATLAQHRPGDALTLTIQRGADQRDVRLTLGETPPPA